METKAGIGDRENRLDELTFEPEPGPAAGFILESFRRRKPTRTIW